MMDEDPSEGPSWLNVGKSFDPEAFAASREVKASELQRKRGEHGSRALVVMRLSGHNECVV